MPEAFLLVLKSPNGRDKWEPVHKADLPAWITDKVMGRMVAGEMAMDPTEEPKGSDWYRVEIAPN